MVATLQPASAVHPFCCSSNAHARRQRSFRPANRSPAGDARSLGHRFATPELPPRWLGSPLQRDGRCQRRLTTTCSMSDTALGLGAFFTPGILAALYMLYVGKGNFEDGSAKVLTDVSQGYFQPNAGGDNIPVSQGKLSDLAGDEPLFKALYNWFIESGGVYKLAFGPKAFIVVSDPVVVRHLLRENANNYDKGVLAEILEPIMGKGLIPADLETWRPRRRAIQPGFHRHYLQAMIRMFGDCTRRTIDKFEDAVSTSSSGEAVVDMEEEFLNLGLDIIGLGVFNHDFGSISTGSPVIQAVYGLLKEAEHRSTCYVPYWDLPFARHVVPRQRQFRADLRVVNDCLDGLIALARQQSEPEDLEALQERDYGKVRDPSLLRFLVDVRGADVDDTQLRDDLMTMLIAGHETTAAVLTWTLFLLMQHPEVTATVTEEIDAVLPDGRAPDLTDIGRLPHVRAVLSESLRLYPQPPILIRRALGDDVLPSGLNGDPGGYPIGKGCDLFISVWNLHRSPHLWVDPHEFRPQRFSENHSNPAFGSAWAGYRPAAQGSSLYPNEQASDYSYIPFGGGQRRCVGDQFAMTEATVALTMMLQRFDFSFVGGPEDVGMATGATIHTKNGLKVDIRKRNKLHASHDSRSQESAAEPAAVGV